MKKAFGLLGVLMVSTAIAADVVFTKDAGGKQTRHTGTISDVKSGRLRLLGTSGREQSFSLDLVDRYEADWMPAHRDADASFQNRDYEAALNLYRTAFAEERRRWVKRKILSRVVWCQRNTNRVANACTTFARLVGDDPDTLYFAAIPLPWQSRRCPEEVARAVAPWMQPNQEPARQLMAASWLMALQRDQSLATLRDLAKHATSRKVSSLALAQLWRSEITALKEQRIDWWAQQIESTPWELRAGPYFLLGRSLARWNRADEAALAYLRVPTLYADDIQLGQASLWEAARALEPMHRKEAVQLLHRAIALGDQTQVGVQAAARLAEIDN